MTKKLYNHMFTIAFEVVSLKEDASDVTNNMLASALLKRTSSCLDGTDALLIECVGSPDDTYELTPNE
jgi:hypothetical protein